MNIRDHADRTYEAYGIRAEDIHKWIDGFFDVEGFDRFLRAGQSPGFNPYDHRKFRHCREALEDAYLEFGEAYSGDEIRQVFESHVRDDYDGYIPSRADFTQGTFEEKYHESDHHDMRDTILSPEELSEYFKGRSYSHRKKQLAKSDTGFTTHIILPTVLAIILFVTSVYFIVIPHFRQSIMDRKREMISELTHTAVSTINYYIEREKDGSMDRESAQSKAAQTIKEMRYGEENKDYFWITDMQPRMVVHPYRPELIGEDLSGYRDREDKSGKLLFVEFVKLIQADGHGYLSYLWQWKDDATQTAPKLSYVEGVPEWDWIVGTGMYINDVEQKINRLTFSLFIGFAIITLFLILTMIYVILQSRRIEYERQQAESGLREAKERYRALAEASNEGYLLEVGGSYIYANHALQRLLGYNEEELTSEGVWDWLLPDIQVNKQVRDKLKVISDDIVSASEFEAQVKMRNGSILDVIISTSRIFFAQKIGHVIAMRPIVLSSGEGLNGFHRETVPLTDVKWTDGLAASEDLGPLALLVEEIEQSDTAGHVIHALYRQPELLRDWLARGVRPAILRKAIGRIYHASLKSFVEISIAELGEPPSPFAFISLGSNARFEMTLFSDQDNALIYSDVEEPDKKRVQKYFLNLGDAVCTRLAQAGYPFCPGGIMASNPQYCLPVSGWQKIFTRWFQSATPESILEMNVFFDLYCAYGEQVLVDEIKRTMNYLAETHPSFFIHFARNALVYKPPLNILGHLKSDRRDGIRVIDVKECIKPIEICARIYALQKQITETSTVIRLKKLHMQGYLEESLYFNLIYVFDALWQLRFHNQIVAHADLKSVNDNLDLDRLTELERMNLRNVLSQIPAFQSKVSFDFLGGAI
ncbi:cache domain-containing protein [bacterium]|nr:cache domain-containing protein [bacterium]